MLHTRFCLFNMFVSLVGRGGTTLDNNNNQGFFRLSHTVLKWRGLICCGQCENLIYTVLPNRMTLISELLLLLAGFVLFPCCQTYNIISS